MKRHVFSKNCVALMLGALLLPALVGGGAFAQTGTSSVRGAVVDPQGDAIAGATVKLTNVETNAERTQVTNESGAYVFELIPPGAYRVEAEAAGFKKVSVTDVRALVAKATEVSVQLEVGSVAETVTVNAGTGEVLLNTQDATLGNNFVSQQITQLPLEARNVAGLLTLQPATTRDGYVAGARADQSNVTLDGVDINEPESNQIGSVESSDLTPDENTVLRLNAEAIDEFRVVTMNPNAQAGRSSGAQISLVTKGGTNDFHGAAFWFHRPTILTANNFFNNRTIDPETGLSIPRPALIRNTYGGALGGPVVKDRAFFFYSYEGRKDRSQETIVRRVPLASLGRGELRYENPSGGVTTVTAAQLGQIFPGAGGVNPIAVAALADAARKYPANDFTIGDSRADQLLNTAGYRFNASLPVDLNSHAGRFDLNLTDRQTLFARVNVQHDLIAGRPTFPDTARPDTWSHPWGLAAGHTWTISNRFVNNFRYGLTREAFSRQGDAAKNEIYFNNIFFPVLDSRTETRTTPIHNFTDDFSWVKGGHTMQFGTNVRVIRNRRTSYANAFDVALTSGTYYEDSGQILDGAINDFSPLGEGQEFTVRSTVAALLGRLTNYTARFTFDKDGSLLPPGTPTVREFATEEYDFYGQDVWKIRPNLTLTFGLRYGLSRPIYETSGFEAKPAVPLSEYFRRRLAAAENGQNYDQPLQIDLSGPANERDYMYPWDRNNFQPRVAVAWSPNVEGGFFGKLFGANGRSVLRGGFGITNDYIGQYLAVRFDQNNQLGFTSAQDSPVSVCNVTDILCPLFTSYSQEVRGFPNIDVPGRLVFPRQQSQDIFNRRIEISLDEEIVSPINYSWNLTFERELPLGLVVQTSYLGRLGRNLLASRDVMMPNNLRDPRSGMDWYAAGGMLEDIRRQFALRGVTSASSDAVIRDAIRSVPAIPYFENLFGNVPNFARNMLGSRRASFATNATQAVFGDALRFNRTDWVTTMSDIDRALDDAGLPTVFYQSQYGALASFTTIGNSDYHAGTLSVRQRLGQQFSMDFNYTLSKSMDDASALQTGTSYGLAFITNPIRQSDNYSVSDFDARHIINLNALWQLPIGRGRWLAPDNGVVDAVLGGWQLAGIFRWNSGFPASAPLDALWSTNWNSESWGVRVGPVEPCPTRGGGSGTSSETPNLFGCNPTAAYQQFRNAKPGETGDRNVFRRPGYVTLDMGLSKAFTMPWSENHSLQLRFEAFNVTNTQRMGALQSGYFLDVDPQTSTPTRNWANFASIQGERRVMQFGFRYEF